MAIQGVDYAFPPWPDPAALAAAGKQFACRYGGPGSSDKWLDPAEAAALSAAGIAIVANAEGSAAGLAGGFAVGASWARTADAWFRKCGMPADRPIYLSVDFDVQSGQWPAVRDALAGAASEIGLARVGVYGGRKAVAWARRDQVATWFWQTYAWSGGIWEPGVHIQQYSNGITVAGADCDLNRAMQTDYGQWTTGSEANDMTPEEHQMLAEVHAGRQVAPWQYKNATGIEEWKTTHPGEWYPDMHAVVWDTYRKVQALEAQQTTGGVDIDKLAAALRPLLFTPDVLAAIAKAVTDEIGS